MELECSKCRRTLPTERFSRDPTRSRGYRCACKDCRKRQRAETEGLPREVELSVVMAWYANQALLPVERGPLVARIAV